MLALFLTKVEEGRLEQRGTERPFDQPIPHVSYWKSHAVGIGSVVGTHAVVGLAHHRSHHLVLAVISVRIITISILLYFLLL